MTQTPGAAPAEGTPVPAVGDALPGAATPGPPGPIDAVPVQSEGPPDEAPDDAAAALHLPAEVSSPAAAREMLTVQLLGWGLDALVDPAVLLVSELVTNAVRHAGTGLRVEVSLVDEGRIRVAVTDLAPYGDVRPRRSLLDDEGGRGLFLVERLSAEWGSAADETGKTVWFELHE